VRGPREFGEVARALRDDGGSDIRGGSGSSPKSSSGSDVGFCFRGENFLGRRILYLDFPLPDVVVTDTGIGIGVAVLDVSVEPDKEEGRLMVDMERGSNGFLVFPFNPCVFANLNLAVSGVSVLSLDSLDEE